MDICLSVFIRLKYYCNVFNKSIYFSACEKILFLFFKWLLMLPLEIWHTCRDNNTVSAGPTNNYQERQSAQRRPTRVMAPSVQVKPRWPTAQLKMAQLWLVKLNQGIAHLSRNWKRKWVSEFLDTQIQLVQFIWKSRPTHSTVDYTSVLLTIFLLGPGLR